VPRERHLVFPGALVDKKILFINRISFIDKILTFWDKFQNFFFFVKLFSFLGSKEEKNIIMTFGSIFWKKNDVFEVEEIFQFWGHFLITFRHTFMLRQFTRKALDVFMNSRIGRKGISSKKTSMPLYCICRS